jgi:uncharacterized membrane protein YoaK (UPF0700 family)
MYVLHFFSFFFFILFFVLVMIGVESVRASSTYKVCLTPPLLFLSLMFYFIIPFPFPFLRQRYFDTFPCIPNGNTTVMAQLSDQHHLKEYLSNSIITAHLSTLVSVLKVKFDRSSPDKLLALKANLICQVARILCY